MNDGPMDAGDWFARMRSSDADKHREEFEAWHSHPENAEAYARAKETWLLLGGVAPAHLAAHPPAATRPRNGQWGLAAALMLALSLGAAWLLLGGNRDPVIVASEQNGAIVLDDGTRVTLIDGTKVDPKFSAGERRVVLTGNGRARFEVAHDPNRPFHVEAAGSITTAIGTVFEIDLSGADPVVHLVNGSVEVRSTNSVAAPIRLAPGDFAVATKDGPRLVPQEKAAAPSGSAVTADRRATLLVAENLPLGAVVERANRVNAIPIIVADATIARRPVTGRFDVADAPALAQKLSAALGLTASEVDGRIVISRPQEKTRG